MKSVLKGVVVAGAAMLALSGGRALAQSEVPPAGGSSSDPTYSQNRDTSTRSDTSPGYAAPSRYDNRNDTMGSRTALPERLTLSLGAGLSDFTGSLGDHTNPGVNWDLRGAYDITPNVGVEVGYLGARNGIDDTRLPTSHSITTTALNGDLRLGAPIPAGSLTIKPYVFGGVGGAYYGVSGDTQLYQSDSDLQFPIGLGGDALIGRNIAVGARLGYFLNVANRIGDNAAGNQLNLTANIGAHY